VPVTASFTWPDFERLPHDIRELCRQNAVDWSHQYQDATSKSYALSCTNERDEGLANVGGSPATLSNGPRSNNSCFLLRQEARTQACGQTKRGDVTRQTAQFSKITKGCGHSNPRSRVPPPRLTSPARIICMLTVSAAASHAPTDSRRLRRNPCLFNALRTVSCAPIPQLRGALSRPLQASA
jgi:hypothetical protein